MFIMTEYLLQHNKKSQHFSDASLSAAFEEVSVVIWVFEGVFVAIWANTRALCRVEPLNSGLVRQHSNGGYLKGTKGAMRHLDDLHRLFGASHL